jgi:hypothetical protein
VIQLDEERARRSSPSGKRADSARGEDEEAAAEERGTGVGSDSR